MTKTIEMEIVAKRGEWLQVVINGKKFIIREVKEFTGKKEESIDKMFGK